MLHDAAPASEARMPYFGYYALLALLVAPISVLAPLRHGRSVVQEPNEGVSPMSTSRVAESGSSDFRMLNVPYSPQTKITVARRGHIVLIGINRPYVSNRLDPEAIESL